MQCDFLEYKGYLFGSWYCMKKKDYIDKSTVNTYCDNSLAFRSCPIYKKYDSGTGCYLTTAMCDVLGKEDDCEELETLRNFRDGYMKKTGKYDTLLEDYDRIGPSISDKIKNDQNKLQIACIMRGWYIERALNAINNNEFDEAVQIYVDMTLNLMENYGLDESTLRIDEYNLKEPVKVRKREYKKVCNNE